MYLLLYDHYVFSLILYDIKSAASLHDTRLAQAAAGTLIS
jgi:hypothetical protein